METLQAILAPRQGQKPTGVRKERARADLEFVEALNAVTNKIYTVNYGSEDVTAIDGATGATTSVPAGKHAWAIAQSQKAVYIGCRILR